MESLPSDIYHVLVSQLPPQTGAQLLIASKSIKSEFAASAKAWKAIYHQANIKEDVRQDLSSAKDYQNALAVFFRVKQRLASGRLPPPRLVAGTLPWLHKGAYPTIKSLSDLHIQDDIYLAWPQPAQGTAAWGGGSASQNWKVINILDPKMNPRPLGMVPKDMEVVFLGGGYFTVVPCLMEHINRIPTHFDIYKMGSPSVFQIPSDITPLHPDFEIRYTLIMKNQRGFNNMFAVYLQYHHLNDDSRTISRYILYSIRLRKAVLDVDLKRPGQAPLTTSTGYLWPIRLGGFLHGNFLIQSYKDNNIFAVYDLESYLIGAAAPIDHTDPLVSSTLKMIEPKYDFERLSSYFRAQDAARNPVLIAQDRFIIFSGKGHVSASDQIFLIDLFETEHFKRSNTRRYTSELVHSKHGSEIVSPGVSGDYFAVCGPSAFDEGVPACHLFQIPSLNPLVQIQPVSEISWIDSHRALLLIRPAVFLIDFNEDFHKPKSSGGLWAAIFGPSRKPVDKNTKPSRPFALVELDMTCLRESIIELISCSDLSHHKFCDANSGYIIFGIDTVEPRKYRPGTLAVSFVVGHSLQPSDGEAGAVGPFSFLELPLPAERSPQAASPVAAIKPSATPPKLQRFPLLQQRPALGKIDFVVVGLKSNMIVDFDPTYFAAALASINEITS
eukprot:TRINITY_DN8429_c0_g1_i1.p1 TRINITY_DN8429_c0_g1~~TRINITY_DN8429_c0_g1_i1.p1  ORF type:complete len:668 (+),score=82.54 TRINITY_DN8429_c0_g1_i1:102-2105(+)